MQGKSRCKNPEQVSEESEISGMKNDETSIRTGENFAIITHAEDAV